MATTQQILGTWILIAFYGSVILYFVIRGALRTKSAEDYALGSVNFNPAFVGLSLATAMTSAATFIINPGLIAQFGVSGVLSFGIFFPIASVASLFVLTKSFRKYGESVKALSLASWLGKRYNSKLYGYFVGILSILLITFIVLILVALTKVFANALNTNEIATLAVIVLFIFGYMMFGGANSMIYTNTIQGFIMIIVAVILIFSGYKFFNDGFSGFFSSLESIDPDLIKSTNPNSPLFRSFFEIAFAQIIVGIAVVCQPHIITKSLLLKSNSDVNKFLTSAILIQMLFFSVIVVGLYARLTFPDLTANGVALKTDSIIPAYVVSAFSGGTLSVVVGLLVIMGLISAGISTLEGLIQSLSTTITQDLVKPLMNKQKAEKTNFMLINKLVIVLLGVVSFFVALDQLINPKLSVAIFAQNGVYAYFSAIFIPILFGIFIKNVPTIIPVAASTTAIFTHFAVYYLFPFLVNNQIMSFASFDLFLQGEVRNPAIASALAIVFSTIVALMFLFFVKKRKKE